MITKNITTKQAVADAVKSGLTTKQKSLPSWLFYDKKGDELFQEIMNLPEYYLSNCETEILTTYSAALGSNLKQIANKWDIIELGAGDGSKTKILLSEFLKEGLDLKYFPIDISQHTLEVLQDNMYDEIPDLNIETINDDYFKGLGSLSSYNEDPKLILFMGANIGNFLPGDAFVFLNNLSGQMRAKDKVLIGFDLMKDPSTILQAYNDSEGVTAEFNYNLLARLNDELLGDFKIKNFKHWPVYSPVTGACKSYLVSKCDQVVHFEAIDLTIKFHAWEVIDTEISQKYNESMINELAGRSGLQIERKLYDLQNYFTLALMKLV